VTRRNDAHPGGQNPSSCRNTARQLLANPPDPAAKSPSRSSGLTPLRQQRKIGNCGLHNRIDRAKHRLGCLTPRSIYADHKSVTQVRQKPEVIGAFRYVASRFGCARRGGFTLLSDCAILWGGGWNFGHGWTRMKYGLRAEFLKQALLRHGVLSDFDAALPRTGCRAGDGVTGSPMAFFELGSAIRVESDPNKASGIGRGAPHPSSLPTVETYATTFGALRRLSSCVPARS
jgi:hypothetical protein